MKRLKLRGRIIEKFGTIGAFCERIGIQRGTASSVLNGKTTPTSRMIPLWCSLLDINTEDMGKFFYPESLENQTTEE